MIAKAWTVLNFMAGDNNLSGETGADLQEMESVGSRTDLDIVVQIDRAESTLGGPQTRRYHVQQDADPDRIGSTLLAEYPNTNTGDPEVLKRFIAESVERFPAQHTMLVLWNHGSGFHVPDDWFDSDRAPDRGEINGAARRALGHSLFMPARREILTLGPHDRGICYDDGTSDCIDNRELRDILAYTRARLGGQKLEILGMDACLMTMIEVAWQVKDHACYLVGSEETEPSAGWPYDLILGDLAANPKMSGADLARRIVARYIEASRERFPDSALTQSAIDLGQLDGLKDALDALAKALLAKVHMPHTRAEVRSARTDATSFYGGMYVDIHDLARLIHAGLDDAAIREACQRVMRAITGDGVPTPVLAERHVGETVARARGLSIYWPLTGAKKTSPEYDRMQFARDTAWGTMLKAYL